ncbi:MAG TPA: ribosome maturation factor RimP [Candidatus Acidoferrum sp.]
MHLEKIREAAERVARSEGLEIVDVEWKVGKERFLRVTIDRVPGAPSGAPSGVEAGSGAESAEGVAGQSGLVGISHVDCERVSRQLNVILDVEDLVSGPGYILEVSSPGMDRELKKAADFQRFTGRLAKIKTAEPVGDSKNFEGRLAGLVDGKVRLEVKGRQEKVVEVPLEVIRKANLVVEF